MSQDEVKQNVDHLVEKTEDGKIKAVGFNKPQAQPAPAQTASSTEQLLQVIMRREARQSEKEEAIEQAKANRSKQREVNARQHSQKRLRKQQTCKHKKGGHNARAGVVDYGVYLHTYIDNEQVIKCFICGMKWKRGDTKEYIVRNGRQIPNHTKQGWAEACEMLSQTTNRPSSSEIPTGKPGDSINELPVDTAFEAQ